MVDLLDATSSGLSVICIQVRGGMYIISNQSHAQNPPTRGEGLVTQAQFLGLVHDTENAAKSGPHPQLGRRKVWRV